MAIPQSDGSIILTTAVDTSGVKNGLNDVKSATQKLENYLKSTGKTLEQAFDGADSKTTKLIANYQKATAEIEKQAEKIKELQRYLQQLQSGEVEIKTKGIEKLQQDFEKTTQSIKNTKSEINNLSNDIDMLSKNAFKSPTTNEPVFTKSEQQQIDQLNGALDKLEAKLTADTAKSKELEKSIQEAMGKATQDEIKKVSDELDKQTVKLNQNVEAANKNANQILDAQKKKVNDLQSAVEKLGRSLAAAFSFAKFVSFTKEASNLAIEAETNVQRLADIYGIAAEKVYNFIEVNAEGIGLSKTLAQGYAATYGTLLTTFATAEENAQLTMQYLRMTSVLASRTGRSVDDVVNRIRSGLLGNTKAIDDLGVFVNVKTIEMTESFARIANGRSWEQLNMYEQNQVRALAILEQATKKFGTEVYNTNGLVRSQFVAAYKEFQATWGQVVNQVLMPILETLTYIFKTLTAGLKTVFNLSDNAEGLFSKQANDILTAVDGQNALAGAVKNTTKEAKKSVAVFDELSILQSPAEDTAAGGATQGTIDFETPLDDTSNNIETSVEQFDEMREKLKAIVILVGAVGTALLAWRISEFLTELKTSEELVRLLATQLKSVVGIFAIIGGSILQIQGYSDGWVNGIDWQNFIKNLGGAALVIAGIALAINPVAAAFVAVGEGIAFLVLGIKDFIDNGANFKNILTIIIGLVTIFVGLMLLVGAPIAAVVTGIAALVAAFAILWNKSEGFRQFWIDLWENIKKIAVDVWGNYVKPVLDYIGEKFTNLWGNHIKPMWEDHLQPALVELGKKIKELWDNVIRPVLSFIGGTIQKLWDNFLKPFIDSVLHVFVDGFRSAFDLIMDIFGTFFDSAGNTIDAVVEIFSGLIDFIVGVFTGDWKKAWNGVKDVFKGVVNGIISAFEAGMNFIIDIVNSFLNKINSAISAIGDIVGADWDIALHLEPIKIPRLATGGIVPRATTALIGEAGREAVLPLENNTEWMYTLADIIASRSGGSGQPIVIELNGRELGRAVIEQGRRENNRVGASLKVT